MNANIKIVVDSVDKTKFYVYGNTFPYKHVFSSYGGKWDPRGKRWIMSTSEVSPNDLLKDLNFTTPVNVPYFFKKRTLLDIADPDVNEQAIFKMKEIPLPSPGDIIIVEGRGEFAVTKVTSKNKKAFISGNNFIYVKNGVWVMSKSFEQQFHHRPEIEELDEGQYIMKYKQPIIDRSTTEKEQIPVTIITDQVQRVPVYDVIYRPQIGDRIEIVYPDENITDRFDVVEIRESKHKKSAFKRNPLPLVVEATLSPSEENVFLTTKLLLRDGEWIQDLDDVPDYSIHQV